MNRSYKIALVAAVVLCMFIIGYGALRGKATGAEDATGPGSAPPRSDVSATVPDSTTGVEPAPPGQAAGDGTALKDRVRRQMDLLRGSAAGDVAREGKTGSAEPAGPPAVGLAGKPEPPGASKSGRPGIDVARPPATEPAPGPIATPDADSGAAGTAVASGPHSGPERPAESATPATPTGTRRVEPADMEPPPGRVLTLGERRPERAGTWPVRPRPAAPATAAGDVAAGSPDAAPANGRATPYAVRDGDTFASIADRTYGAEHFWPLIQDANPDVDPRRLRIGQTIHLPARSADGGRAPADRARAGDVHVVSVGDTLSAIARRYYGRRDRWQLIYRANRQTIGSNPDRLVVGDRLRIPPPSGGPAAGQQTSMGEERRR